MSISSIVSYLVTNRVQLLTDLGLIIAAASIAVRSLGFLVEKLYGFIGFLTLIFPALASADGRLRRIADALTWVADRLDALGKSKALNFVALTPNRVKSIAIVLALAFLTSSQAQAQGFDFSAGPSVPFLEYDFGNPHPISIAPGAGVQASVTHDIFKREFFGKSWDLADLDLMAFGSAVSTASGQQFGELSAAAALCTLSSLVCVGAGKHLFDTGHVFHSGGWFAVLSLSFNFALAPTAPPLGVERGAAGLPRGNTLFLGSP